MSDGELREAFYAAQIVVDENVAALHRFAKQVARGVCRVVAAHASEIAVGGVSPRRWRNRMMP